VVEPDGRIQSVNQAVLVLLKYRPEDIIGRHIAMLFAAESGGYSENDAFQMWKDRNQPTEK
jgi:PAS domain-containing protein